ncbi:hypothetical protein A2U01_0100917, partial [Trifolium medium]|nr:hypothetical protein [Trifolium medium]
AQNGHADTPDSIYPAHGSGSPAVPCSVSENAPTSQPARGTAGSRKE